MDTSSVIPLSVFSRALDEAEKRIRKDLSLQYSILLNSKDMGSMLEHRLSLDSVGYRFFHQGPYGYLLQLIDNFSNDGECKQIPVKVSSEYPKGFIQVLKEDTSILVASLDPNTTFPFGDCLINTGASTIVQGTPRVELCRKGLPPRISLKGWNSLPFPEARDLVLSGGFNLKEVDGATESSPHVEQVQRKFYTFRGDVDTRFPEMTFPDTCYILFVLDAIVPYPNLQSGIQKALTKNPDFFKKVSETLYEKLQGVSASFCGGCDNDYMDDVAGTVADMLKTWYFSLTAKATPTKESLSIPVANRSDETLLHEFQQDHPELDSIENELERRSKGKPFLVYQDDDCSILDMRNTLSFLKDCRKKEVASQGQYRDPVSNKLLRLFRISEVNWKNRIREICPLDPKSILYRGYCSVCDVNFSRYSYPQRQAIAFALRSIETKGQDYTLLFKTKIIPYLQEHPDGEGIYTWLQDNGFRYLHSDLHQATVAGTLPVLTALENPISSDGITKDMHPYFRKGV